MAFDLEFNFKSTIPLYRSILAVPSVPGSQDPVVGTRRWRQVRLEDSIDEFYPKGQLLITDNTAELIKDDYYIEALSYETELGSADLADDPENPPESGAPCDGYIRNKFIIDEQQLQESIKSSYPAGTLIWPLISEYSLQDPKINASYMGSFDTVFQQIYGNYTPYEDLNAVPPFIVSPTSVTDKWYQVNMTNEEFLMLHRDYMVDPSSPKSPYYTFINLHNQFHFCSLFKLLSQQPIATLKLYNSGQDDSIQRDKILDYEMFWAGTKVNFYNYMKQIAWTDSLGTGMVDLPTIMDYTFQSPMDPSVSKRNIRMSEVGSAREYPYYGIVEPTHRQQFLGWQNSLYRKSALSFKMALHIYFNPKIVAGKVVKLEMQDGNQDAVEEFANEFSGNWLVTASKHFTDHTGVGTSWIIVARNGVDISKQHKLYGTLMT